MSTITEVEKLAFELSFDERALLAAHLLGSLPPILDEEDEGIAEALHRDAELNSDHQISIGLDQLDREVNPL